MTIRPCLEALEDRATPAAFQTLPVLPFTDTAVLDHARAIVARGSQLGLRDDTFIRMGDSNSSFYGVPENPIATYLVPLGAPSYNPSFSGLAATHPELLDTWSVYRAAANSQGANSFSWLGPSTYPGFGTNDVLGGLDSALAISKPGIALIMIGTNEVARYDPGGFKQRIEALVSRLLTRGVLPVMSSIPPYEGFGGSFISRVEMYNQVIADVATSHLIPFWNVWRVCQSLPGHGLIADEFRIHLSYSPNGGGGFWPADMAFAQNMRNLQALQILDWYRERVVGRLGDFLPQLRWQPLTGVGGYFTIGRDLGSAPVVDVIDADTNQRVNRLQAFNPAFNGGVRVATAEVNADGYADIVCVTASRAGTLRVFSGENGAVIATIAPFGHGYFGGLTVAASDLTGDGIAEIVVGRAAGGSGVRVYSGGSLTLIASFQAFPRFDAGGVSVAVVDIERSGPVIAIGAAGDRPVIRFFEVNGSLVSSLRVFQEGTFGVVLAAVDLDGDGADELAVAPRIGRNRVRIIDPVTGKLHATFTTPPIGDPAFGIRLGSIRSNSGGSDTLLIGNAPGSSTSVLEYHGLAGAYESIPFESSTRAYGIFVG